MKASGRSIRRRRSAAAALLAAGACAAAAVVALPGGGRDEAHAQAAAAAAHVEPQLGPGLGSVLLGSAPQGTSGDPAEAWAYRVAGPSLSRPAPSGQPLEYGAGEQQVVLLRYTSSEGWRHVQTPLTSGGAPYAGGNPGGGRVTPRGGLVLATNEPGDPAVATQHRLLVADRGGRIQAAPQPDGTVLPADEYLSLGVLAADDDGDHTVAYAAIEGSQTQTGVARYESGAWSREPICVTDSGGASPAGCSTTETLGDPASQFKAVSISAAGGHAWLLGSWAPAVGSAVAGRGLVLFERVTDGGTPRWRLRSLGLPQFEAADPPGGIGAVAPLASPYALTATPDGVWIDGGFNLGGTPESLTVWFDGTSATTWCDGDLAGAPVCNHPIGARFGRFHRSFAWPGAGVGSRVIADAKRPGEAPDSPAPPEYITLDAGSTDFTRHPTFNGAAGGSAAFGATNEGWVGWSHITTAPHGAALDEWPIPDRQPLTAIAGQPGKAPGDIAAGALAVGEDGTVLRYTPGQGWDSEQLLGSSGVARPTLRGVSWPSDEFAYAVGDDGAMWRWRKTTGLWEPDPGAPFDFVGHLLGVAFQPGNPDRGYAVGRAGVLLRYDKSWTQEPLPPEVQGAGPLGGPADLMSVAFAGSQALVAAWNHLLVNDGGAWRVDGQAQSLIDQVDGARIYAVAGLPDGGAVAAGLGIVLIRDRAGAPWRFADQPLPDQIVTAAAAFREGDKVRALVSVTPELPTLWPEPDQVDLPPTEPGQPPARPPSFSPPTYGTLLRETASGWRDEQRALFRARGGDHARKPDPASALLVDSAGNGWIAGGWTGFTDSLANGAEDSGVAHVVATGSLERYRPAGPEPAPQQSAAPVSLPGGRARLLVGGNSRCVDSCAGLDQLQLMPDRTLAQAAAQASAMAGRSGGPRAFLYTSAGQAQDGESLRVHSRLDPLAGSMDVFAAIPGDVTPRADDVGTSGGTVRVVMIDNSSGSLDGGQRSWLVDQLHGARTAHVPAIVLGERSLNRFEPDGSQAADADDVARLLRDDGASAYVYDSPEAQRSATIPAGDPNGIPTYGSGTLGYRQEGDSALGFGVPGLLMLEVDVAGRNATTNRAPVSVRLIPAIEDVALEAVDGRVLERSQPALFRGLGRRPRSGDRWVQQAGGSDPYVQLPNPSCALQGCSGRIDPEVRFTSSNPDVANFVRQDPQSDNPRKPFIDKGTDKPVADASSGLLCAFNAGTTRVSVEAGGLAYSTTVTVRAGSVLRPCGTVPLQNPTRQQVNSSQVGSPSPAPSGEQPQPVSPEVAPPPVPPAIVPPPLAAPAPAPPPPARPALPPAVVGPPAVILPFPVTSARPLPPWGTSPVTSSVSVFQPAVKVEKQREEEEALEHQQSASRYQPGDARLFGGLLAGIVLSAALGAAALRSRPRGGDRGTELARSFAGSTPRRHWRHR